jgi:shikimate dehydrogenase
VNTVVNDGGRLTGHNTDWVGATRALEEVLPLDGARVLLLGAGGAARAIAFGLRERGAQATVANRDLGKAERVAVDAGARAAPLDEVAQAGDYDVVINATTVGQADAQPGTPVREGAIRRGQVVMDIVYKPVHTELLERAAARGATTIHGGRMLLHQAAAQFELYSGRPAPLADMDAALHAVMGAR